MPLDSSNAGPQSDGVRQREVVHNFQANEDRKLLGICSNSAKTEDCGCNINATHIHPLYATLCHNKMRTNSIRPQLKAQFSPVKRGSHV